MDMRLPSAAAAAHHGVAEAPPPLRLLKRWQPTPGGVSAAPLPAPRFQRLLLRLLGR